MPREKDKEKEMWREFERGSKRKREEKRKYLRKRESGVCLCIHILPQALQRLRLAYNTSGNESES